MTDREHKRGKQKNMAKTGRKVKRKGHNNIEANSYDSRERYIMTEREERRDRGRNVQCNKQCKKLLHLLTKKMSKTHQRLGKHHPPVASLLSARSTLKNAIKTEDLLEIYNHSPALA